MSRQRYVISGKVFSTKGDLVKEIRRILYSYAPEDTVSSEDAVFLRGVLSLHPDSEQKIGVGVRRFFVRINWQYGNNRCFWLERVDGVETDWSFMEALKPASNVQNVMKAMRWLIKDQIVDFRNTELSKDDSPYCAFTGDLLSQKNSHVDHASPLTFEVLANNFACAERIDLANVKVTAAGDGDLIQRLDDEGMAERWKKFHQDNALLRLISSRANLSHAKKQFLTHNVDAKTLLF